MGGGGFKADVALHGGTLLNSLFVSSSMCLCVHVEVVEVEEGEDMSPVGVLQWEQLCVFRL